VAEERIVLVHVESGVAVVTLNRPEARNALSRQMIAELRRAMAEVDRNDDVAAVVLTGADPAFCAGLDLKELGQDGGVLNDPQSAGITAGDSATGSTDKPATANRGRGTLLATSKPVIGAVNGVAVTGGLELALNCDFLVASERARFADTHARIGVQPLWGLTVLLPEAVGLRRAREMSATGNFVDAGTALAWGLVNHVVPHDELLGFARRLAADIATSDRRALRTLFDTYQRGSLMTGADAWLLEGEAAAAFHGGPVDPAEIERRRHGVVQRGRSQL
jgi:enoyl-CoA hydratase